MFYHIEGIVSEIDHNLAVIDCAGIGFELNVTVNTLSNLKLSSKAKLYVSEGIGESNFDLYGFFTKSEKRCFEMLTSVSGIGPKAALSILSYNSPEGLALAIMNGDEKALTVAPGIGKKNAQRVILELKDKISKELGGESISLPVMSAPAAAGGDKVLNDALTALSVLGFSSAEIAPILRTLDINGMSTEQIIKAVLKHKA